MATLNQTTLAAALSQTSGVLTVASATNITAPVNNIRQQLYIIGPGQMRGELMEVVAISGTQVSVSRLNEFRAYYPSGSIVLIGPSSPTGLMGGMYLGTGFAEYNPPGANASPNSNAASAVQTTPWVNVVTGEQWLWSTLVNCWVPGWNNPSANKQCTAAVASVAGTITPTGPMFHITGALAITGIVIPVGFTGGSFTVIPDGTFTWTTGDGSIGVAGTAVVSRALTFTYSQSDAKWYPSYV